MHPNWNLPMPGAFGPPSQVVLWEDFVNPVISSVVAGEMDLAPWLITPATAAGTVGTGHGGEVITTFNATETGLTPTNKAFECAAGRTIYWETRVQQSSLTPVGYYGLALNGTPSDDDDAAIFWTTTLTGVLIPTVSRANADLTATTTAAIVAATYVTLAIRIIGLDRTIFYVNGAKVGEIASTPAPGVNIAPVNALSAAGTFTTDYILVIADR